MGSGLPAKPFIISGKPEPRMGKGLPKGPQQGRNQTRTGNHTPPTTLLSLGWPQESLFLPQGPPTSPGAAAGWWQRVPT